MDQLNLFPQELPNQASPALVKDFLHFRGAPIKTYKERQIEDGYTPIVRLSVIVRGIKKRCRKSEIHVLTHEAEFSESHFPEGANGQALAVDIARKMLDEQLRQFVGIPRVKLQNTFVKRDGVFKCENFRMYNPEDQREFYLYS